MNQENNVNTIIAIIIAIFAGAVPDCDTDFSCEVELPQKLKAWANDSADCNSFKNWTSCQDESLTLLSWKGEPIAAIELGILAWSTSDALVDKDTTTWGTWISEEDSVRIVTDKHLKVLEVILK